MAFSTAAIEPTAALEDFAQVYGCRPEDFEPTLEQLEKVWKTTDETGATVGVLGLRATPVHGCEILGGVLSAGRCTEVAAALLGAALAAQPRLYAYADETSWPLHALEQAGLRPFRAYTRSSGNLPSLFAPVPDGFQLLPLAEVADLGQRWAAQEGYSDLIGHTTVSESAIVPGAAGSDDTLGCIALDALGKAVGVCRVWRDGESISLTTPGIRPEARGLGLRQAMLSWVCRTARTLGIRSMTLEAWGDNEEDRVDDETLGLTLNVVTPIYTSFT